MESPAFTLAAGDYVRLALLLATAAAVAALMLVLAHALGPRRHGPVKDMPYESGMDPVGGTRRRFGVRFYLVAVLFLVFDVELLFLYPWAVLYPRLTAGRDAPGYESVSALAQSGYTPAVLLVGMGLFFTLLLVGFVYEWRRGVFRWN